jgi:hypothetical protein
MFDALADVQLWSCHDREGSALDAATIWQQLNKCRKPQ